MSKASRIAARHKVRSLAEYGRVNLATLSNACVWTWCSVVVAGAVALDLSFETTGYVLIALGIGGMSVGMSRPEPAHSPEPSCDHNAEGTGS